MLAASNKGRKKINILYCLGQSSYLGGAEVQLMSIIKNLDRGKFSAHVLFPNRGRLVGIFKSNGIKTKVIPTDRWDTAKKKLLDYVKINHIDLLHVNTVLGFGFNVAIILRLVSIPAIWHIHCRLDTIYPHLKGLKREKVTGLIKSLSGKIIACSKYAAEQFKSSGDDHKVLVINNGIDIKKFQQRKAVLQKKYFRVGMVGRLSPEKRPEDFIRAAFLVRKEFPEVKFVIVGGQTTADYLSRLKKINRKNKNAVIFRKASYNIPKIMNSIDLLVLPSIGDASPLAILEAMACNLPVVACNSGGIPELISDQIDGILVSPENPRELSRAIINIIRDPDRRLALGRKARKKAKINYDIKKTTKKIEVLYLELLKNKSREVNA